MGSQTSIDSKGKILASMRFSYDNPAYDYGLHNLLEPPEWIFALIFKIPLPRHLSCTVTAYTSRQIHMIIKVYIID